MVNVDSDINSPMPERHILKFILIPDGLNNMPDIAFDFFDFYITLNPRWTAFDFIYYSASARKKSTIMTSPFREKFASVALIR